MRVSLNRQAAAVAFAAAAKVTPSRSTIPALSHVLISVSDGAATLTATDFDIRREEVLPATVHEAGACLILADALAAFATSPGDTMEIETDDTRATLRIGKSTARLPYLPALDYPASLVSPPEMRAVDVATVRAALGAVSPSMGSDTVRLQLNGAALSRGHVVATDGHRMHVATLDLGDDAILPDKAVHAISAALDKQDDARFGVDARAWGLHVGSVRLCGPLVDSKFPDWERVSIAADGDPVITDAGDLERAISIALCRAKARAPAILCEASGDQMRVFYSDGVNREARQLEGEAFIPCAGSGEFTVNARYLVDAAKAMGPGEIAMWAKGGIIRVSPAQTSAFGQYAIVMGVRA